MAPRRIYLWVKNQFKNIKTSRHLDSLQVINWPSYRNQKPLDQTKNEEDSLEAEEMMAE